jgi:pimeloyl-ACP methyl ester carboxylesterase
VAARISAEEAGGSRVQLQELDLPGDLVVLALGDLDSAASVAVLVPGIRTTPEGDLGSQIDDARNVATAARAASPGLAVAGVVWLGYRPPGFVGALSRDAAETGGPELDASLRGLAAARPASGHDRSRTAVIAHSYGTVVTGEAAAQPGRLAADAVVLLGSPGMRGNARSLETPEVYDAATLLDPVAISEWFGTAPWQPGYGATELPVDWFAGHTDYYDPARPTMPAIGAVVAGTEASH